jgi:hypothetical protein
MGKVLMRKTVFDNKTGYHRAGEIVTVSADVERHYLANNYAIKAEAEAPAIEIVEPKVEAVEVETKEEKLVYETKSKKSKKDAADQD